MRTLTIITLVAASLLSGAEKQEPPVPGTPKAFTIPAHETYSLANGMRVTLVPWGTLPVASVGVNVDAGNLNETKDQVWLADFTAALMKEGSAGKTGEQIANEAAKLGGELNFSTGGEASYASMDSLAEFAPHAVALLGDFLRRPDFPVKELERIRANLLRRVVVEKVNPQSIAQEAFSKTIYGEHPFGRLYPTEEQLKGYTLEQVKQYYAANFGAKRAHLYVAGQFDVALVKASIAKAFDSWPAGPAPIKLPPSLKAQHGLVFIDRPKAEQSNLLIGMPVPANPENEQYLPMQVTDSMLGGAFFSRITSNIREDKGYTYSPYSYVETHRGSAVWIQSADVTTKVTAESIREIFKEISGMRKEPPSEKELQAVKNALTGQFVLRNASPGGVIRQMIFTEKYGLGDKWLNAYVPKLNGVTRSDVQRIAESMLDPAKMTIVVVGDKEQIGKSLDEWK